MQNLSLNKFYTSIVSKITIETILLLVIILIGVVARLYKFPEFPPFTDEIREALVAYELYSLKQFPLTSFSMYIGPIHAYFLAIIMWIFGPNIWLPRIINLIFNIGLIYAVYVFGKEWANKNIGLLTALFVALNPTLILINSRIAWATCLAPLFGVLLLIVIKRFEKKNTYKKAIYIGLISGVLVNLHPLLVFFVLPLILYAIYLVFKNRETKKRLKLLGTIFLSGLFVMIPLLLANLLTPNVSIKGAMEQDHYSKEGFEIEPKEYLRDLDRLIAQEEHVINRSIIFDGQTVPEYEYRPIYHIDSPFDLPFIVFLFGILFMVLKRDFKLLPILGPVLFMLIFTPFLNSSYFDGLTVRYYSVLIPIFEFFAAYAIYAAYKFTSNILLKSLVIFLAIIIIIFVPYSNLENFYESREDLESNINLNQDVSYLRGKEKEGYNIYYIEDISRKSDSEYSFVEYIIKFGGIKNANYIDKEFTIGNNNLLVISADIEEIPSETIDDLAESLKMQLIYQGEAIAVYK